MSMKSLIEQGEEDGQKNYEDGQCNHPHQLPVRNEGWPLWLVAGNPVIKPGESPLGQHFFNYRLRVKG